MKKSLFYFALLFFSFTSSNAQEWIAITSPTTADFKSCSFVTATLGWIITDTAVYKTTDGGITWVAQIVPAIPSNDVRVFSSIHFISDTVGIIGCANTLSPGFNPASLSNVLWTNNGGATWEYKDLGAAGDSVNDAKLVDTLIAYAIGRAGMCKKTVDGGLTWTPCDFSVSPQSNSFKLAAISPDTVYFGGLDFGFFTNGSFGSTLDGGVNWDVVTVSNYTMRAIAFTSSQIGFLGGGFGTILGTNDGGASWTTETTDVSDGSILDISFATATLGWAVTDSGRILHTADAGATWNTEFTTSSSLRSVSFSADSSIGYAVGDSGTLLKYGTSLGIEQQPLAVGFTVYPNPSQGAMNINLANTGSGEKSVSVYTMLGQLIKTNTFPSDTEISISRDKLPAGIYLITLTQGSKFLGSTKIIFKD
ncbi:YCF48-related protein [Flavobacterium sp. UBA7682]|uniref:T9SS type A sorting domain-containing protein n=1 Tax=Flavobacterium sp. UBA7682 TaxID=1946560 RepID=UPI0025C42570|nr:YCF48-related protein [Flavobacterium sp. UBA7682]